MDTLSRSTIEIAEADGTACRRERLDRIARLIDRPVESLIHGLSPGDEIGDAAELMSLWQAIRSAEDRRRLLSMTRALAER